jgi:chromosome segregation ATPase
MNNNIEDPVSILNHFIKSLRARGQELEDLKGGNKSLKEEIIAQKEAYEQLQIENKSLKEEINVLSNENKILKKTVNENDDEIQVANTALKNLRSLCTTWEVRKKRIIADSTSVDLDDTHSTSSPPPPLYSFSLGKGQASGMATSTHTIQIKKRYKLNVVCHRCKKKPSKETSLYMLSFQ